MEISVDFERVIGGDGRGPDEVKKYRYDVICIESMDGDVTIIPRRNEGKGTRITLPMELLEEIVGFKIQRKVIEATTSGNGRQFLEKLWTSIKR